MKGYVLSKNNPKGKAKVSPKGTAPPTTKSEEERRVRQRVRGLRGAGCATRGEGGDRGAHDTFGVPEGQVQCLEPDSEVDVDIDPEDEYLEAGLEAMVVSPSQYEPPGESPD